jgi:CspA family cold shock protein
VKYAIDDLRYWSGARYEAKIKWFDNAKGYGFALIEECPFDVFVHYRSIIGQEGYKTLSEGDAVYFLAVTSDKGLTANECVKISTLDRSQLASVAEGESVW